MLVYLNPLLNIVFSIQFGNEVLNGLTLYLLLCFENINHHHSSYRSQWHFLYGRDVVGVLPQV
ncbi:hypothetical protein SDC9_177195 [bioreactor metagenome]|uniref:Uncharacterized protein n=1 Tax=bioreactor metagenome TaxID=1076179 RepID=A0A645GUT0_9ZZZZ